MGRAERVLLRGRRRAEALMVDECRVREVERVDTNPDGTTTTVYASPDVYVGKCKIQNQRLRYPAEPDAGEHLWTVGPTEVHLPIDGTAAVETGHHIEITASLDPANVDRVARVRIGDRKTFGTALRLLVEEVVA